MLGSVGFAIKTWNLKEFAQYYDMRIKYLAIGKNKVRLNRFEDYKQEDIEWLQNILKSRVDLLT